MRTIKFQEGEIYHIFNRGVEKRNIFVNEEDYLRFIHDLFEFNDEEAASPSNIRFSCRTPSRTDVTTLNQCLEVGTPNIKKRRKLLVEILAFCLMPNHFHLLLRQVKGNGITNFMRKLGGGYAMYFNQKYERPGALFQGRFKAVLVEKESHFIHLPYYIHLNPLDLITPGWRKGEISNCKKAMKFLENYRWSSFQDYIGKKNFPSVTQRNFLSEFFGGPRQYYEDTQKWLKELDLKDINDLTLEN